MTALYQNWEIQKLEQLAVSSGIDSYELMSRAGKSAFTHLIRKWPHVRSIAVFCGGGNNGGDGYVLARLAHEAGYKVTVYATATPESLKGDAQKAATAFKETNSPIHVINKDFFDVNADVIVDALIGTGLSTEVRNLYAKAIEVINSAECPVLSMDVPSGLDSENGSVKTCAVRAAVTVTFIGAKRGLFTGQAQAYCGEIIIDTLDIPSSLFEQLSSTSQLLSEDMLDSFLPKRSRDAHKGIYGHVLVVGGDYGMGGAVRLAAEAALRVGAGLVSVATRPEHVTLVSGVRPELMCHQVSHTSDLQPLLERASVLVIGPGLGQSEWAHSLLEYLLDTPLPKVLDADSLNLLSQHPKKRDDWILTPHPGEASRLLNEAVSEIQSNRFGAVSELQSQYGGVVVLKGAGTLVKGESKMTYVCPAGNPGMASGGMGDVLSGVIGGLLAQKIPLLAAANLGVFIHSTAADRAAKEGGERGLLATDLLSHMRPLVNPNI